MSATESNHVKQSLCHHRASWCNSETCIQGVLLYFGSNTSYLWLPSFVDFLQPLQKK